MKEAAPGRMFGGSDPGLGDFGVQPLSCSCSKLLSQEFGGVKSSGDSWNPWQVTVPQGSAKACWDLFTRQNKPVSSGAQDKKFGPSQRPLWIYSCGHCFSSPAISSLFFILESQASPISRQLRPLTSCLESKELRPKSEPSTQTQPRQPRVFPGISPPCHQTNKHGARGGVNTSCPFNPAVPPCPGWDTWHLDSQQPHSPCCRNSAYAERSNGCNP